MIFHRSTPKATKNTHTVQKKNHNNNNMVKNITLKTALHQMHKQTKVRNVVKHHKHTLRKMRQHTRIIKGGVRILPNFIKSIFLPKKRVEYKLLQNPRTSASAKIKPSDSPSTETKPNTVFTYYTNDKKNSPINNGDEFFIVINTSKTNENPALNDDDEITITLHYKINHNFIKGSIVSHGVISNQYTIIGDTTMIFTRYDSAEGANVVEEKIILINEKRKIFPPLLICNDTNPPYYYYDTFKVARANINIFTNTDDSFIKGSNIPTTSFSVTIKITLYNISNTTITGRNTSATPILIAEIYNENITLTKVDTITDELDIINFVRETSINNNNKPPTCRALIKKHETTKPITITYLDYLKQNLSMPETEHAMLSRMNTNIKFYYCAFLLAVEYNNGQTQSKGERSTSTDIIKPQQAHLAYYLNNIDKTHSTLSVMLIMHILCEDFTLIISKDTVEKIWSNRGYATVNELSFEFANKDTDTDTPKTITIISNNKAHCNNYKFIYKVEGSTKIKETYIIGVESTFNITDDDCKKLVANTPNKTLMTITIANVDDETITFNNTILDSTEVFTIIPSTQYIALLKMFNDEFRVSPDPPVNPVQATLSTSTSTPILSPTLTSKTHTPGSSSIRAGLHQTQTANKLIKYTSIYYKLTSFSKKNENDYIIYIEIVIDKNNTSNPEKLRIYYTSQTHQTTQTPLRLMFALNFNYEYNQNTRMEEFEHEYMKILLTKLGISFNEIRDDAKAFNKSGKDTRFTPARNNQKAVKAFQTQTYGQTQQQTHTRPLITLPKDNIFKFNIGNGKSKHRNNTYMWEMVLHTVYNKTVSKPVKNAQDFIVLLEQICAINTRYNLYTHKSPILIDLTINNDTQQKQLKIELIDTDNTKEIAHINSL